MNYRPTAFAGPSVDPARWRHPLYCAKVSGLFEVTTDPLILLIFASRI